MIVLKTHMNRKIDLTKIPTWFCFALPFLASLLFLCIAGILKLVGIEDFGFIIMTLIITTIFFEIFLFFYFLFKKKFIKASMVVLGGVLVLTAVFTFLIFTYSEMLFTALFCDDPNNCPQAIYRSLDQTAEQQQRQHPAQASSTLLLKALIIPEGTKLNGK